MNTGIMFLITIERNASTKDKPYAKWVEEHWKTPVKHLAAKIEAREIGRKLDEFTPE